MKLRDFAEWFKVNPLQSATSIQDALRLNTRSSVASFLSQVDYQSEIGVCPLSKRERVQLFTFVSLPEKPKPSIASIRRRRRAEMPQQTAAGADERNRLIYQETVEPCEFPAMCYGCGKNLRHKFERVAVVGRESVVKATCKVCGKETTK